MSLNLPHRYPCYGYGKPSLNGAYDDVSNMRDRAAATIMLLQTEFIAGNRSLEDSVIFNALESVRLELSDIDNLLTHLIESQKEQPQKSPN